MANISVDETVNMDVQIYPNPVYDQLFISFNELGERSTVEIISVYGRLVYKNLIEDVNSVTIPVDGLKSGVYFVRVADNNKQVIQRIIKQ